MSAGPARVARAPHTSRRAVEATGTVRAQLASGLFRVELDSRELVLAHATGDVHKNYLRLLVGDRVRVALSPANRTRGRITGRV